TLLHAPLFSVALPHTPQIYTLSLHDALPILIAGFGVAADLASKHHREWRDNCLAVKNHILSALAEVPHVINGTVEASLPNCLNVDRKSTRLNSSHVKISYAVFCLKK